MKRLIESLPEIFLFSIVGLMAIIIIGGFVQVGSVAKAGGYKTKVVNFYDLPSRNNNYCNEWPDAYEILVPVDKGLIWSASPEKPCIPKDAISYTDANGNKIYIVDGVIIRQLCK